MSVSPNDSGSEYVDDHKASSWSNLKLHIFGRSAAPPPPSPDFVAAPPSAAPELDTLAKVNEELRERCIHIVAKSDELIGLRNEFIEVFRGVDKILRETEGTSSALAERSAILARETEEHGALKTLYRALNEESEKNRGETGLLRSEIQRYGDLVAGREARIRALEAELSAEKDNSATLRGETEQHRYVAGLATEKLQSALTEIGLNESLISGLQGQVAALSDRCSTAEFHVKAMQGSLAESQNVAKGLRDALAESQHQADSRAQGLGEADAQIAGLRQRADELESSLSSARLEYELAQTLWQQRGEANTDEIEALKAEIDAQRSRADAGDELLAETRAELQTVTADSRAKQRVAEQLEVRIASLDEYAKQAAQEIADLNQRLVEAEKSGAALADRSQALVRAMNDQKAKLESAEERCHLLEERLAVQSSRFTADSEQFQQKIRGLVEKLEEEKVARVVISGALEAARRSTANHPRGGESTLLDIFARAVTEADAEDRQTTGQTRRAAPAAEPVEPSATAAAEEELRDPALGPAESAGGAKRALPRARPLVIKREKQHGGGRH
jgi:chromosome segregation ATPase